MMGNPYKLSLGQGALIFSVCCLSDETRLSMLDSTHTDQSKLGGGLW